MSEAINELIETLSSWNPLWAYGFLLISAFLENVIPPVPGDTVVVFSAYLVGRGALEWLPVYLTTCLGGTIGFMVMYYLGLTKGRSLLDGVGKRYFSATHLARAEGWLERYGMGLILANRFLSGIRSVVALSAGVGRMPWKRVAALGFASMAVWNGMLLYAGALVGENWDTVMQFLQTYNKVAMSVIALSAAAIGIRVWRSRRRPSS
jgi:membrane protein DedA with SNARE-associated domain